jgi:hypothetical protein
MSVDVALKLTDYAATPTEVALRSLLGGALTADWRQALIARGFGWNVTVGTLSTGVTGGGAGTVLDLDQPEFGLSVPTGYTLIPLDFHIQVNPGLQTTDSHVTEALIAVDRTAAWAGDGTVTTETPLGLRTNVTSGCPATCFSAATADITDPVLSFELARAEALTDVQGTAANVNLYQVRLDYEPKTPPLIVGPGAVYGYWGGSIAATGYAQLNFLVIPSSLVNTLA